MVYLEAILALFAIVDPVGNIPAFIHIAGQIPSGRSRQAFNAAAGVAVVILLTFSFTGSWILERIFHVTIADLQVAGGVLLLIIAIDHLIFGALKKAVALSGAQTAVEIGCVPLACPLLAGPGAMVTSLTILQDKGPLPAVAAIVGVFALVWIITRFIGPIHKFLGMLFCTVFSKVMCIFIASIGVHMIMSGLKTYLLPE